MCNFPSVEQFSFSCTIKLQLKNLSNAVDVLSHSKNVRVVIIRSILPNVFCAGADLKERATMTPAEVQRFVTSLRGLLKDIEQMPVPVISALDGMCLCNGYTVYRNVVEIGLVQSVDVFRCCSRWRFGDGTCL